MPDTVTLVLASSTVAQPGWFVPVTLGIFILFLLLLVWAENTDGDYTANKPNHPSRRKGKRK